MFYLTDESAIELVTFVKDLFGETGSIVTEGDITGDGQVDVSDLVFLIDYLFAGGPVPPDPNAADVNASCGIDISDVSYLVEYLFQGGPAPLAGCVQ